MGQPSDVRSDLSLQESMVQNDEDGGVIKDDEYGACSLLVGGTTRSIAAPYICGQKVSVTADAGNGGSITVTSLDTVGNSVALDAGEWAIFESVLSGTGGEAVWILLGTNGTP